MPRGEARGDEFLWVSIILGRGGCADRLGVSVGRRLSGSSVMLEAAYLPERRDWFSSRAEKRPGIGNVDYLQLSSRGRYAVLVTWLEYRGNWVDS